MCHHEVDLGTKAESQFFATSHGKGPCDGVGGTIKRAAVRASQRPYSDQIMTPRQSFEYAKETIAGVHFQYCTIEEVSRKLEARFSVARTIPAHI